MMRRPKTIAHPLERLRIALELRDILRDPEVRSFAAQFAPDDLAKMDAQVNQILQGVRVTERSPAADLFGGMAGGSATPQTPMPGLGSYYTLPTTAVQIPSLSAVLRNVETRRRQPDLPEIALARSMQEKMAAAQEAYNKSSLFDQLMGGFDYVVRGIPTAFYTNFLEMLERISHPVDRERGVPEPDYSKMTTQELADAYWRRQLHSLPFTEQAKFHTLLGQEALAPAKYREREARMRMGGQVLASKLGLNSRFGSDIGQVANFLYDLPYYVLSDASNLLPLGATTRTGKMAAGGLLAGLGGYGVYQAAQSEEPIRHGLFPLVMTGLGAGMVRSGYKMPVPMRADALLVQSLTDAGMSKKNAVNYLRDLRAGKRPEITVGGMTVSPETAALLSDMIGAEIPAGLEPIVQAGIKDLFSTKGDAYAAASRRLLEFADEFGKRETTTPRQREALATAVSDYLKTGDRKMLDDFLGEFEEGADVRQRTSSLMEEVQNSRESYDTGKVIEGLRQTIENAEGQGLISETAADRVMRYVEEYEKTGDPYAIMQIALESGRLKEAFPHVSDQLMPMLARLVRGHIAEDIGLTARRLERKPFWDKREGGLPEYAVLEGADQRALDMLRAVEPGSDLVKQIEQAVSRLKVDDMLDRTPAYRKVENLIWRGRDRYLKDAAERLNRRADALEEEGLTQTAAQYRAIAESLVKDGSALTPEQIKSRLDTADMLEGAVGRQRYENIRAQEQAEQAARIQQEREAERARMQQQEAEEKARRQQEREERITAEKEVVADASKTASAARRAYSQFVAESERAGQKIPDAYRQSGEALGSALKNLAAAQRRYQTSAKRVGERTEQAERLAAAVEDVRKAQQEHEAARKEYEQSKAAALEEQKRQRAAELEERKRKAAEEKEALRRQREEEKEALRRQKAQEREERKRQLQEQAAERKRLAEEQKRQKAEEREAAKQQEKTPAAAAHTPASKPAPAPEVKKEPAVKKPTAKKPTTEEPAVKEPDMQKTETKETPSEHALPSEEEILPSSEEITKEVVHRHWHRFSSAVHFANIIGEFIPHELYDELNDLNKQFKDFNAEFQKAVDDDRRVGTDIGQKTLIPRFRELAVKAERLRFRLLSHLADEITKKPRATNSGDLSNLVKTFWHALDDKIFMYADTSARIYHMVPYMLYRASRWERPHLYRVMRYLLEHNPGDLYEPVAHLILKGMDDPEAYGLIKDYPATNAGVKRLIDGKVNPVLKVLLRLRQFVQTMEGRGDAKSRLRRQLDYTSSSLRDKKKFIPQDAEKLQEWIYDTNRQADLATASIVNTIKTLTDNEKLTTEEFIKIAAVLFPEWKGEQHLQNGKLDISSVYKYYDAAPIMHQIAFEYAIEGMQDPSVILNRRQPPELPIIRGVPEVKRSNNPYRNEQVEQRLRQSKTTIEALNKAASILEASSSRADDIRKLMVTVKRLEEKMQELTADDETDIRLFERGVAKLKRITDDLEKDTGSLLNEMVSERKGYVSLSDLSEFAEMLLSEYTEGRFLEDGRFDLGKINNLIKSKTLPQWKIEFFNAILEKFLFQGRNQRENWMSFKAQDLLELNTLLITGARLKHILTETIVNSFSRLDTDKDLRRRYTEMLGLKGEKSTKELVQAGIEWVTENDPEGKFAVIRELESPAAKNYLSNDFIENTIARLEGRRDKNSYRNPAVEIRLNEARALIKVLKKTADYYAKDKAEQFSHLDETLAQIKQLELEMQVLRKDDIEGIQAFERKAKNLIKHLDEYEQDAAVIFRRIIEGKQHTIDANKFFELGELLMPEYFQRVDFSEGRLPLKPALSAIERMEIPKWKVEAFDFLLDALINNVNTDSKQLRSFDLEELFTAAERVKKRETLVDNAVNEVTGIFRNLPEKPGLVALLSRMIPGINDNTKFAVLRTAKWILQYHPKKLGQIVETLRHPSMKDMLWKPVHDAIYAEKRYTFKDILERVSEAALPSNAKKRVDELIQSHKTGVRQADEIEVKIALLRKQREDPVLKNQQNAIDMEIANLDIELRQVELQNSIIEHEIVDILAEHNVIDDSVLFGTPEQAVQRILRSNSFFSGVDPTVLLEAATMLFRNMARRAQVYRKNRRQKRPQVPRRTTRYYYEQIGEGIYQRTGREVPMVGSINVAEQVNAGFNDSVRAEIIEQALQMVNEAEKSGSGVIVGKKEMSMPELQAQALKMLGTLGDERFLQLAARSGADFDKIVMGMRMMIADAARRVNEAREKAAATNSDYDVTMLHVEQMRFRAIMLALNDVSGTAGRALRAHQEVLDQINLLLKDTDLKRRAAILSELRRQLDDLDEATWRLIQNRVDKILENNASPEEIMQEMRAILQEFDRRKFGDILDAMAYVNVLSGTTSWIQNGNGNFLKLAGAIAERYAAAFADPIISKIYGREGGRITVEEASAMMSVLPDAIRHAAGLFKEVMKYGATAEQTANFRLPKEVPFPVWRELGRIMPATDAFFYYIAHRTELAAQAMRRAMSEAKTREEAFERYARLMEKPDDDLLAAAARFADEATFRPEKGTEFNVFVNAVDRLLEYEPPGFRRIGLKPMRMIVRFFRTLAEIARQGAVDYTGIGLLHRMMSRTRRQSPEMSLQAVKALLGLAIMGVAMSETLNGNVQISLPQDPSERAMMYERGMRPLAWNVFGSGFVLPLQFMSHLAIPFILSSAFTEYVIRPDKPDQDIFNRVLGMGVATGASLLSTTPMQNLTQFINAMDDPSSYAHKFIGGVALQFVPFIGMQRSINLATNDIVRDPETLPQVLMNNIPFASHYVKPHISPVTGKPSERHNWKALNAFIIRHSTINPDKHVNELMRLGIFPSRAQRWVLDPFRNQEVYLTKDLHIRRMEMIGAATANAVIDTMRMPTYETWSDDMRRLVLRQMMIHYRGIASEIFRMRYLQDIRTLPVRPPRGYNISDIDAMPELIQRQDWRSMTGGDEQEETAGVASERQDEAAAAAGR